VTGIRLQALTARDIEEILGPRPAGAPWATDYPTQGDVEVAGWARDPASSFPSTDSPWCSRRVIDADSELVIGGIGFHSGPDESGTVEIGYGIAASFRGRGAATAAVAAILDIAARAGARRMVAGTEADNVASQRALERNGFVRTTDDGDEWRWEHVMPDCVP
jgi:RimJ/RimL family protein N-acetyltransferase